MRHIQVSEDILPLVEFKTHASSIIKRLNSSRRPIVITLNGKPAAVLLAPEEFDFLEEHKNFLQAIKQGLSDVEEGRLISDEELELEFRTEWGHLESP